MGDGGPSRWADLPMSLAPMSAARASLTGLAYMVLANGSITINNALIKLAVVELPPMQAMFLRAIAAVLLGLPVLAATSSVASLRHIIAPRVLLRSIVECGAAMAFVLAVATAPLADLTAILQLTPMLVLLGAVLFFGDKVPRIAVALVGLAMLGALLVAQPGGHGLEPYVLFGMLSATLSAGRDLLGRRVGLHVPGLAVAIGVSAVSILVIGAATLLFEHWVTPNLGQLALIAAAGAFLTLAQLLLFLAFRVAPTRAVLPFFYTGTLWALVIGALVFGTLPNGLALVGMALIMLSGVLVVVLERRGSR
jgi:drug/metabolite transporter (DMT)-like permease